MCQFGNVSICYLRSRSSGKHHNWCNWNTDVADGMDVKGFFGFAWRKGMIPKSRDGFMSAIFFLF
ncbi:MAG: hypothetical protein ACOVQR_04415 [Flavobacterium sp.]|uniref:hypothetical protein n=1 Tax=Flavobacterium sp. TaxID=239 RepID=UPI003BA4D075